MNITTNTKEMKRGKQNIALAEWDVPLQCGDVSFKAPSTNRKCPSMGSRTICYISSQLMKYVYQLYAVDLVYMTWQFHCIPYRIWLWLYKSTATIVCGFTAAMGVSNGDPGWYASISLFHCVYPQWSQRPWLSVALLHWESFDILFNFLSCWRSYKTIARQMKDVDTSL